MKIVLTILLISASLFGKDVYTYETDREDNYKIDLERIKKCPKYVKFGNSINANYKKRNGIKRYTTIKKKLHACKGYDNKIEIYLETNTITTEKVGK